MNNHSEQIANQPKLLRKQAFEALTKAKELEKEQMANGATYISVGTRSRVLIKPKKK